MSRTTDAPPRQSASRSRPSLQALPDWSAVPSNSEDDRIFLNLRLAYFARMMWQLSGAFLVFNFVLGVGTGQTVRSQIEVRGAHLHLLAVLVFGAVWLLCRRANRSSAELNVIDVGGLTLALSVYGWMATAERGGVGQALILALIALATVVTRAIMVPGTSRRTTWVSAMAMVPVVVATYGIGWHAAPASFAEERPWIAFRASAYVAMWGVVTVAISRLATRIIYGLSRRVREATELGQYTLEQKIGEGGMGAVYRARHSLLRRPTAVKLLPRERAGGRNVERFEREVQLTASLTHPNTIAIYDYGHTPDGVFYYAMEYLEGITLEELVAHDGPQPPGRVTHLLQQILGALEEAHGIGLIHRDIKPANLMLCVRGGIADMIKVLDFGLVKDVGGSDANKMSQVDALLGTPLYMAPEAITAPDAVDARVDLYAVGAVAYQLLTGTPVFEGTTVVEICAKHLHDAPVPLSVRLGRPVPPSLERLVLQCLAKSPEERPASAASLAAALRDAADVPPWSPADAKAWWKSRAPALLDAIVARRKASRSEPGVRTVAIDLAER